MMEKELSIEELISALRHCVNEGTCDKCPLNGDIGCIYSLFEKAADALEQLNDFEHSQLAKMLAENTRLAEKVPHWISVKDRLPEEDGNYLAVMDGDLCGQEEPFTSMCGIEKGKWDEPNMVLYWMPLPKTPKEEK